MASSSITVHRDTAFYIAKLADVADDYEEVVTQMKHVAKSGEELTVDERKLFESGYDIYIKQRRYAWETVSTAEKNEEAEGRGTIVTEINEYKRKIEMDIVRICTEVVSLIEEHLIPSSRTPANFVFYYTMKGDYYKYRAEIKIDAERKKDVDLALEAYEVAIAAAEADLQRADPARLRLDFILANFYHEILGDTERACAIADKTFDEASPALINLTDEAKKKESSDWLNSLNDKMTVWSKLSTIEPFDLD